MANQDNYLETVKLLATRLLASGMPLRGSYGSGGLQRMIEATSAGDVTGVSTYAEYEGAGSNCTLHAELEYDWMGKDDRLDAEGNEWRTYHLNVNVNWPCHGSTQPDVAMARLAFYQKVVALAADLKAEFGERRIQRMTRTAAELVEYKAKCEAARIANALKDIVEKSPERKGMRVKTYEKVASDRFVEKNIPAGTYTVEVGSMGGAKTYQVDVESGEFGHSCITRVV